MGSKKLVWCCILGIVLGYLAPFALPVLRSTSLSIGMVAGLGVGYLLDILDEKKGADEGSAELSKKARDASRLMEKARAELQGRSLPEDDEEGPSEEPGADAEAGNDVPELSQSEQAERLSEAEEMLRQARERISEKR